MISKEFREMLEFAGMVLTGVLLIYLSTLLIGKEGARYVGVFYFSFLVGRFLSELV